MVAGEKFTISVGKLYEKHGDSFENFTIKTDETIDGDTCFDLYDTFGLCCCDGEVVQVWEISDDFVDVINDEGFVVVHMLLSHEDFETACAGNRVED